VKIKRNAALSEYQGLFNPEARGKMILRNDKTTKSQHPFLTFYYDKRYIVHVYKLNSPNGVSLSEIIQLEKGTILQSKDVIYSGYGSGYFDFLFQPCMIQQWIKFI
jgi:hypothetical protein